MRNYFKSLFAASLVVAAVSCDTIDKDLLNPDKDQDKDPVLTGTTKSYTLNSQSDVAEFAINGFSTVDSCLKIGVAASANDPITSLESLEALKSVGGDLVIGSYYQGEDIDGLDNLESVGGDMSLVVSSVSEIELPKLATIGGVLTLESMGDSMNTNFDNFDCFEPLTSVNGVSISNFEVKDFEAFADLISSIDAAKWSVTSCIYNPTYEDMVAGLYSNIRILTFEDADYKAGVNYVGESSWSSLIDTMQYGGAMLYSDTEQYTWTDENNTWLNGVVNQGVDWNTYEDDWRFWTGGIVVSNYYAPVVSGTAVSYDQQLSLSNGEAGAAGNNGSANFAIVNDGAAGGMGMPVYLTFGDDKARTIDHLYISSTSYLESVALDGNAGLSDPLGADNNFTIEAIGFDADGNEIETTVKYEMAVDGALVKGWNKWDLSSLGKVSKIRFNMSSNLINGYGTMSLPSNFAIDDVAVEM